jgi:hypothetical protein
MSTFGELVREIPVHFEAGAIPIRAEVCDAEAERSPATSIRDEQIHSLVQQLFFQPDAEQVRNVGFTPVEASSQTAALCLDVAKALVGEGKFDVGLIDAGSGTARLQQQLQIPTPALTEVVWPISSRLWLVPHESWWPEAARQLITDQNLERLRELMTEFDYCIVYCAPVSWLIARIGQNCDGLVLVLTANKTRRLVAAQVKDHLYKTKVPLLGTILEERRFPVPQGLYRSL